MRIAINNKLPAWVSADSSCLRLSQTRCDELYEDGRAYALNDSGLLRCLEGRDTRQECRRLAEHHVHAFLTEDVANASRQLNGVANAIDLLIAPTDIFLSRRQRVSRTKTPEAFLYAGFAAHMIVHGIGRRLYPSAALLDSLSPDRFLPAFESWRDEMIVRAQTTLDCYEALGRKASRLTDATTIFAPLVNDASNFAISLRTAAERMH